MPAADGQRFEDQPQEVQDAFYAVYGSVGPGMWELEHNVEIGQAPELTPAPGYTPEPAPAPAPVPPAYTPAPSQGSQDTQQPPPLAPQQPAPPAPTFNPAPAPSGPGDTSLQPGSMTPFGTIMGEGDLGLPLGLGVSWHQLLLGEIARRTDATGRLMTLDANGNIVDTGQQTLAAAWQEAQRKLQEAALTGLIDGQPTLAAQQLKQQADQFAQQMGLSRDQLAAQIAQFAQQFGLQQAAVTGTYNGAPTEAARQFNETLGFQQQQALAQASADPNRIVESANLGRLFGAARGGLPGGNTGVNALPAAYSTGAYGAAGAAGTQGTGTSGAPAQFGLSPELRQYLRGEVVPQFGNPTATPTGTMTSIEQLRQSGFNARMTPQAYRNLSPTGRTELGAINLAVSGQRPGDLAADIWGQLPSQPSRTPSAYRF